VEAELVRHGRQPITKGENHMLRKIAYSLGGLALLAMAVGAGFKPN
jgi:hypothetical protein